jgi:hypothetical protein
MSCILFYALQSREMRVKHAKLEESEQDLERSEILRALHVLEANSAEMMKSMKTMQDLLTTCITGTPTGTAVPEAAAALLPEPATTTGDVQDHVTAGETTPVRAGETAPVPPGETAPVSAGETAHVPAGETAPVPAVETAPVSAGEIASEPSS